MGGPCGRPNYAVIPSNSDGSRQLTKLNVSGTAVTQEGVKDAKKFLPFWATVTR